MGNIQQQFQQVKNQLRQQTVADRINRSKIEGTYSIGGLLDPMVQAFSTHLRDFSETSRSSHQINKMISWLEEQFQQPAESGMWISRKSNVFDLLSLITVEYITARLIIGADRHGAITALSETYKLELQWSQLLVEEFCIIFADKIERVSEFSCDKSTKITIRATEAFCEELERQDSSLILRQKELWPMLEKPQDWTGFIGNPYNDESLERQMIRKGSESSVNVSEACRVLNTLQSTPYNINNTVLNAAKKAFKDGDLDVFKSKQYSTWEARKAVRGGITTAKRKIKETFKAASFLSDKTFYIPYCLDYRGRVYPMNTVLSSQGSEFEKALYQAAKPTPVGEHGGEELLIQLATTFGSKESLDQRIAWAKAKIHELDGWLDGSNKEWQGADEPFLALATAEALVGWRDTGFSPEYKTACLVYIDASNSGFQLCAGMLRDDNLAPLVNLVPSDTVGDLYTAVAQEVQRHYEGPLSGVIGDRKVWKRPVMCLLYSLTFIGAWKYIMDAIKPLVGNTLGEEELKAEITKLTHIFFKQAMPAVAPQGFQVLDTIQSWSKKLCKVDAIKASGTITWTMPGGLTVQQHKRKVIQKQIFASISSGGRVKHVITTPTDKIDSKGHASSIVPNIIHSIDASLLWSVVCGMSGHAQLPCHDAFSTTAGEAALLGRVVRQKFVDLVESNPLAQIKAELEERYEIDLTSDVASQNLPEYGDLNLEAIRWTDHSFR